MADDERWAVEGGIERALIETHHLANLSDLPEAELARRRLVAAQSADSLWRTRDHLEDASEFLELARLARRDCAAGFAEARDLVSMAEAALSFERPVPLSGDPVSLFRDGPVSRPPLDELQRKAAVSSFEQLKYDVAIEEAFAEIRRQAYGVDDPSRHVHADPVTGSEVNPATGSEVDPAPEATAEGATTEAVSSGQEHPVSEETGGQSGSEEIGVEEALRVASLEMDIQRSLMQASASAAEAESEFEFVSTDELASRDEASPEES